MLRIENLQQIKDKSIDIMDEVIEAQAAGTATGQAPLSSMNGHVPGSSSFGLNQMTSQNPDILSQFEKSKQFQDLENAFQGKFPSSLIVANNPNNLYSHARLQDAINEGIAFNYQHQGRRKTAGLFHGLGQGSGANKVKLEGFSKDYVNKIRGGGSKSQGKIKL